MARTKKQSIHYVDNKQFLAAMIDYKQECRQCEEQGQESPPLPDYIGECFMKIAEGLSHKPNFIRYTYRDEMVMDAVENCIKAIGNYNVEAATRTGKPNAFAYFTQISYFAFLRRIAKEKKQQDIKLKYIEQSGFEAFADLDGDYDGDSIVERIKARIDAVKVKDESVQEWAEENNLIKKRRKRKT